MMKLGSLLKITFSDEIIRHYKLARIFLVTKPDLSQKITFSDEIICSLLKIAFSDESNFVAKALS